MTVRILLGELSTQPEPRPSPTAITITQNQTTFEALATFIAAMVGFSALTEVYNSPTPASRWQAGHEVLIDSLATSQRLAIEPYELLAAATSNYWPHQIEMSCFPIQRTPGVPASLQGIAGPYISGLSQAMFTNFYEDHKDQIEAQYGSRSNWPSAWQFGAVVRNALSHGGSLDIRHPTHVSWGSLSYSQSDNGRPVILKDIWPGDLILLMVEMEAAL